MCDANNVTEKCMVMLKRPDKQNIEMVEGVLDLLSQGPLSVMIKSDMHFQAKQDAWHILTFFLIQKRKFRSNNAL